MKYLIQSLPAHSQILIARYKLKNGTDIEDPINFFKTFMTISHRIVTAGKLLDVK